MFNEGRYCYCPVTHKATLGEIVALLQDFSQNTPSTDAKHSTLNFQQRTCPLIPEIPAGSFAKKLYSTYLSYLPYEKTAFPLKMNVDDRGSFTELVHTLNSGQVSINISKPGITKGQHWHHTKWEQFIVVKGHGLIQQRNLNDPDSKVLEWEVDGDHIQAVHMLPGYTHNIINLSDTEDLVTVMYCNEIFNPNKPDTFFEKV
jgi:UDP-2-acetamido-2,6-beta-L-arabino-hexul-4-ose reductase